MESATIHDLQVYSYYRAYTPLHAVVQNGTKLHTDIANNLVTNQIVTNSFIAWVDETLILTYIQPVYESDFQAFKAPVS